MEEKIKVIKKAEKPISVETKERIEELFGKDVDPMRYFIRSNVDVKLVPQKKLFSIFNMD